MHFLKLTTLLFSLLGLTSCFKTAEDIRREKAVDQMQVQVGQSSQIIADLREQVSDLQSKLASTTGQLEEIDHQQKELSEKQKKSLNELISQLSEQVNLLIRESKIQRADIDKLKAEVNAQKDFTKKVTNTLDKISENEPSLTNANKLFEANKLNDAENMYLDVLEQGNISNAQKNAVHYNLGLINYWNKKYEIAASYFSKIYTKWPKSSYAPRSLLYIARSFDKLGKKAEAKAAYQELINKYPNSNQAKEAQKEIK